MKIEAKNKGTVQITRKTKNGLEATSKLKIIDAFAFTNSKEFFGDKGYYITSSDYDRLTKNLDNVDKKAMKSKKSPLSLYNIDRKKRFYTNWSGLCYGMSAWTCLVNNGTYKASFLSPSANSLKGIECREPVQPAGLVF